MTQKFDYNALDLAKQKGFYSFKYMSDFESFKKELPHQDRFYSSLTDKKISDKEFKHVANVWNKFQTKTMTDYYDLYLECDVLLLADIFEKFRNNSLKNYGLYSSHYLSELALSWNVMLEMTNVELKFILDPDMYIYSLKKVQEVQ